MALPQNKDTSAVASMLTSEIQALIAAKKAVDSMAEDRKELVANLKSCKERVLNIMQANSIDKANFDNYAVSVATSKRRESVGTNNRTEILKRVMPDEDAGELSKKIEDCLTHKTVPFIRLSQNLR